MIPSQSIFSGVTLQSRSVGFWNSLSLQKLKNFLLFSQCPCHYFGSSPHYSFQLVLELEWEWNILHFPHYLILPLRHSFHLVLELEWDTLNFLPSLILHLRHSRVQNKAGNQITLSLSLSLSLSLTLTRIQSPKPNMKAVSSAKLIFCFGLT